MSSMVAGAASGLLMASVFVCAGVMMLFSLVRDPPAGFRPLLERVPAPQLAMSAVFLAYPAWGVIGALAGIVYKISDEQAPGGGLGSPNLVFTVAVVVVTLMMAAPFAVLLRRMVAGVVAMALASIGLFGWFLPYFAG